MNIHFSVVSSTAVRNIMPPPPRRRY